MNGRRVPRPEREREMLEAARRLFGDRGFSGVSMDEIAAAVGITKPMLYSYFGSKEGLFEAAAEAAAGDLRDAVRHAARTPGPPDQRLWRGISAVFAFVEENAAAWELLYPSGPGAAGPFAGSATRARDMMAGLLAELFAELAIDTGVDPDLAREEAEPQAWAMTGATIAAATYWRRHPGDPRELHALRLMNFAWQGLGAVLREQVWLPPPEVSASIASGEGREHFAERVRRLRGPFLEDAFRRMPDYFLSESAGGRSAVIEWQITGRPDGGHDRWQVIVENGSCRVERDGDRRPSVRFRLDAVDFLELVLGRTTGPQLVARGRMRIRGRPLLALRIASWFAPIGRR